MITKNIQYLHQPLLSIRILIRFLFDFPERWKHKKCTLDEVFKGAVIFLEAAIMEPASQIAGAQVIFDMDGLSLQQTWQFSPPFAKRIVDWLQVRIRPFS